MTRLPDIFAGVLVISKSVFDRNQQGRKKMPFHERGKVVLYKSSL